MNNNLSVPSYISTWDSAINNECSLFDVVVVGGGQFGLDIATKLYRGDPTEQLRILVLEAGEAVYPADNHLSQQALAAVHYRVRFKLPELVNWIVPWQSNIHSAGIVRAFRGRDFVWGGCSPRLTEVDLVQWPESISAYLRSTYPLVEKEIGVHRGKFLRGRLFSVLRNRLKMALKQVPALSSVEALPLAVLKDVFPDAEKYSVFPAFQAAVLEDIAHAFKASPETPDQERRLFVVTGAQVTRLHHNSDCVNSVEVYVRGQRRTLPIKLGGTVVLAATTIENTRLALESFPNNLMGRNLVAHTRSNLTVRIHKEALSLTALSQATEGAGLLIRGSTPQGAFHLQITAASLSEISPKDLAYRLDHFLGGDHATIAGDSKHVVLCVRAIGEMRGSLEKTSTTSWISLDSTNDEYGYRKARVNLVCSPEDEEIWQAMNQSSIALVQHLAKGNLDWLEYWFDGSWHKNLPPDWDFLIRDGLGTSHHEGGSLWLGENPNDSVTNLDGKFHHVDNVFVVGPAVFPTNGSANPALTAFALNSRTAQAIVRQRVSDVEPLLEIAA